MGTPEPPTFATLERLAHSLIEQLRQRLALAVVEMAEEELRFARALGWQLTALFLTCLTIMLAALLPIAIWWDTPDRWVAIAWVLGVVATASGGMWAYYAAQVRHRPLPFAQTIEELRRDAQALAPQVRMSQAPLSPDSVPPRDVL